MFKDVPSQVDFTALEREILEFWDETAAFEDLCEILEGGPRWSFIDGPITANNPMGVHHAWGRTYKDLWQRYKAMQGYDQRWQNGFDCQGLWVEVEVEKELGFQSKRDIEEFGVAPFVVLCKQRVLDYSAIQTEQSVRLGMWMDWNDTDRLRWLGQKLGEDPTQEITFEGPRGPVTGTVEQIVGQLGMSQTGGSYYTFSDENNYQIWMFLQRCWENGWLYKGRDVMPWCARCGTGISQHEIVTDGYQELIHDALYVRFPLRGRDREALLVWTTTPWTLTSNVAAAVGPDLTYLKVRHGDWTYYLAKATLDRALPDDYQVMEELTGAEMVDWTYDGPFDELPAVREAGVPQTHRVIPWKEVGEDEGTGVVHIAPGCGAEDFELGVEFDLPVVAPLSESGIYLDGFAWLSGRSVHAVADDVADSLRDKGLLERQEPYAHRYPTCWRCQEELVFRLVDEWFISMDELRHQIIDVARQIRWIPDFGLDRELDWLRNMHDWMISKKRYWGLALPIWECGDCGHFEVIGGEKELQQRAIEGWEEFEGHTPHRPYIDAVVIRCPECGSLVNRIPDVGNPWLDAGIVPYSTLHYRDDRDYWRKWFPADFITESFPGQFRNWFYSLLAMSTVLENRPPFETVLGFATLLAEDGREMHKSWGNAIEFNEAAESMGADAMRWAYCAHRPEQNLLFGYGLINDVRRRFILQLWNVYSFFVTYAHVEDWVPEETADAVGDGQPLDRWVLARLQLVIEEVTESLDDYNAYTATRVVERFVDDLSNWYVRSSRRRFWEGDVTAFSTLYRVLVTLNRLLAPFMPFMTEEMYQNLVRSVAGDAPTSVHHTAWPTPDAALVDEELLADTDLIIQLASLGRAARSQAGIKLRQPLATAFIAGLEPEEQERIARLADQLRGELNVKALTFAASRDELVEYGLNPVLSVIGPQYGELVPEIKLALAELDARQAARRLQAGEPVEVTVDGQTIELGPEEVEVQTSARPGLSLAEEDGYAVAVDVDLTPELRGEGLARDVVRHLQEMRKEAGFEVTDRIHTRYQAEEELAAAIEAFSDYIAAETLSLDLEPGEPTESAHAKAVELNGLEATLAVQRVEQTSG